MAMARHTQSAATAYTPCRVVVSSCGGVVVWWCGGVVVTAAVVAPAVAVWCNGVVQGVAAETGWQQGRVAT